MTDDITTTPCSQCTGFCCDTMAITLNVVDVARIVRTLDLQVHDLLARYIDEDPKEEPYVFYIRKQPISLALNPPGEKTCGCPFLMKIGDDARCGIYNIRPGTCRVYPFSRNKDRVYHKRNAVCPKRFKVDPQDPTIHKMIDDYQRDWDVQAVFCKEWNANPPRHASFEKLLDFVEELIEEGRV
ncbi:MAG: YkgJ family cysteine cluster protein [Armatimonadota bacterium]